VVAEVFAEVPEVVATVAGEVAVPALGPELLAGAEVLVAALLGDVERSGVDELDSRAVEEVVLFGWDDVELVVLEVEVEVAEGAGGATDGGFPAPNAQPSTVPGAGLLLPGPML
jgi:hypothetical protein